MPRKFFNKMLPHPGKLRDRWYLKPFNALLHDPALWATHRKSVSRGLALGLFIGSLPVPGHMALSAIGGLLIRVNIPVAIVACLFTNPLTIGPFFFFTYKVGTVLLGIPPEPIVVELSFEWLGNSLEAIWKPLVLGSFLVGIGLATLGFAALNLLWRISLTIRYYTRHRRDKI